MNPTSQPPSQTSGAAASTHSALTALLLAAPLLLSAGCSQVRYTESFVPEGDIQRVVLQTDSGAIELVSADSVSVQRAIRSPKVALSLSHRVVDGTLFLDAHCVRLLPCAVDTRVGLPADLPVTVELGSGEIWSTGINSLTLELDSGDADVDLSGTLQASIGSGSLHARLGADSQARVGIGKGDIDIEVTAGSWTVDADTSRLRLDGLEPQDKAPGSLELTAPAGSVTVRATMGVARR